jgi:hypothetical protein
LRIEDRRLLLTRIQSGDGQQHLHIRRKAGVAGASTTRWLSR